MHDGHGGAEILSDRGQGSSSSTATSTVTTKSLDVEELEMLLEAYFVQIDGTLNKLSTVMFLPSFVIAVPYFVQMSNVKSAP